MAALRLRNYLGGKCTCSPVSGPPDWSEPAKATALSAEARAAYSPPMNESKHWDQVYERRAPDQVSWYRPHLERSLALIEHVKLPTDAAIIDVGGGTSTLVDDLLDRGSYLLTVLDISSKAITTAR